MQATLLIQVMTILILSLRLTLEQGLPIQPSVQLTKSSAVATATINIAEADADVDDITEWINEDEESEWTADETDILQRILQNTLDTLASNGIDGMALLDGYRFRRQAGDYIGDVEGRMGIIDHNIGEITLSDKAFTVQHGFAIYHELGHAVDYQLNRKLSEGYEKYTGGSETSEADNQWQTADNYWLRLQGRNDREEAAADAFAVLVMSRAGLVKPIFANQPVSTDYDGISDAAALALQTAE